MVDYDFIIKWCDFAVLLAYFILILFMFYYVLFLFLSFRKPKKYPKAKKKYKYCVIIPARNEDKVIKNILTALKNQTYDKDKFDVYTIVESKDDPTIKISRKFGYKSFIRKDLVNHATKGFAIQEFLKYLNKNNLNNYDAYIIFDADNIMDRDYIEKLNDLKYAGYQVGFGYRNFTNTTLNWNTMCSALIFDLVNQIFSKGRSILFKKIMINGTGYFIDKKIIDDIGGWIFTGMAEDVQVSTYCTYHDVKMGYYETIEYYDEQATDFKTSHTQHIRWIWGFLASRKDFKKRVPNYHTNKKYVARLQRIEFNIALFPLVTYIVLTIVSFLIEFCLLLSSFYFDMSKTAMIFWHSTIPFFSLYFIFVFLASLILMSDNKHLKLSFFKAVFVIFTFEFYFLDFVSAFFDGIAHPRKRKSWAKVVHSGEITNQKAKDSEALNCEK